MKRKALLATALICVTCIGLTACSKSEEKTAQDAVNEAIEEAADSISDAVDDLTEGLGDSGSASEGDSDTVDMSAATEKEWGNFTISVPGGWEFSGGDVFDSEDTSLFSLKQSTLKYFDIKESDKETGMNTYNYNKDTYTNGQKDVSGTIGDFSWTGFQYEDGFGGYGFELYTEVGDKLVRVSSAGYEFGSAIPEAVLATLHVKG